MRKTSVLMLAVILSAIGAASASAASCKVRSDLGLNRYGEPAAWVNFRADQPDERYPFFQPRGHEVIARLYPGQTILADRQWPWPDDGRSGGERWVHGRLPPFGPAGWALWWVGDDHSGFFKSYMNCSQEGGDLGDGGIGWHRRLRR